jgi:uncharacterized protein YcfL
MKYIILTVLSFFIIGCTTKQPVLVEKERVTLPKEEKKEEIVQTFSKKLNLNIQNRENKQSLFSLGYKYFNK